MLEKLVIMLFGSLIPTAYIMLKPSYDDWKKENDAYRRELLDHARKAAENSETGLQDHVALGHMIQGNGKQDNPSDKGN